MRGAINRRPIPEGRHRASHCSKPRAPEHALLEPGCLNSQFHYNQEQFYCRGSHLQDWKLCAHLQKHSTLIFIQREDRPSCIFLTGKRLLRILQSITHAVTPHGCVMVALTTHTPCGCKGACERRAVAGGKRFLLRRGFPGPFEIRLEIKAGGQVWLRASLSVC